MRKKRLSPCPPSWFTSFAPSTFVSPQVLTDCLDPRHFDLLNGPQHDRRILRSFPSMTVYKVTRFTRVLSQPGHINYLFVRTCWELEGFLHLSLQMHEGPPAVRAGFRLITRHFHVPERLSLFPGPRSLLLRGGVKVSTSGEANWLVRQRDGENRSPIPHGELFTVAEKEGTKNLQKTNEGGELTPLLSILIPT